MPGLGFLVGHTRSHPKYNTPPFATFWSDRVWNRDAFHESDLTDKFDMSILLMVDEALAEVGPIVYLGNDGVHDLIEDRKGFLS